MRFHEISEGEVVPFPKAKRPEIKVGSRVKYGPNHSFSRHLPHRVGTVQKVMWRNGKGIAFMAWDDGGHSGADLDKLILV